jgi:hypothetical protein
MPQGKLEDALDAFQTERSRCHSLSWFCLAWLVFAESSKIAGRQPPTMTITTAGPPVAVSLNEVHSPFRGTQFPKRVDIPLILNDITVMFVQHISASVPHIFGGTPSMPEFR